MAWTSATIDEVVRLVEGDLMDCTPQQASVFLAHRVDPYFAPITRFGSEDRVVVVAKNNGEVIYWEDVEEGFGLSPVGADGHILEQDCNQNTLGWALNRWIK